MLSEGLALGLYAGLTVLAVQTGYNNKVLLKRGAAVAIARRQGSSADQTLARARGETLMSTVLQHWIHVPPCGPQ